MHLRCSFFERVHILFTHSIYRTQMKISFVYVLIRHMLGEDLESLNLKELQHLEKQLDRTLSQARQRKVCNRMILEYPYT